MQKTISTALLNVKSGIGPKCDYVAEKDKRGRITMIDFNAGTMAVIYMRDTQTTKVGEGFIIRNVQTSGQNAEPKVVMGAQLRSNGQKIEFPKTLVSHLKGAFKC